MEFPRPLVVPGEGLFAEEGHLLGEPVGGGGDGPHRPQAHHGEGEAFQAAEDEKVPPRLQKEVGEVLQVLGGVLEAHDVGEVPPQAPHGLGGDLHPGPSRDVVDEEGKVGDGPRHLGEVAVKPLLVGLDVVGDDDHGPLGPGLLGEAGELQGLLQAKRPGPRDHGNAARHLVQDDLYGPLPLLQGLGAGLARGAPHAHAVGAPLDDPLHEAP